MSAQGEDCHVRLAQQPPATRCDAFQPKMLVYLVLPTTMIEGSQDHTRRKATVSVTLAHFQQPWLKMKGAKHDDVGVIWVTIRFGVFDGNQIFSMRRTGALPALFFSSASDMTIGVVNGILEISFLILYYYRLHLQSLPSWSSQRTIASNTPKMKLSTTALIVVPAASLLSSLPCDSVIAPGASDWTPKLVKGLLPSNDLQTLRSRLSPRPPSRQQDLSRPLLTHITTMAVPGVDLSATPKGISRPIRRLVRPGLPLHAIRTSNPQNRA